MRVGREDPQADPGGDAPEGLAEASHDMGGLITLIPDLDLEWACLPFEIVFEPDES